MSDCTCGGLQQSCNTVTPGPCNPVNCDQDLSGDCCVKVVQFVIISAVQGINDEERILVGPEAVAFSDDMTPDGFVSFVIAKNADKITHVDKKSLRVLYCVLGRTPVMGIDLQEAQVAILADIAHKLPSPKKEG